MNRHQRRAEAARLGHPMARKLFLRQDDLDAPFLLNLGR